MPNRNDSLYLEDIYSSIKKIQKYTNGMAFEDFEKDGKTVDAVIRNLEILGEASKNISSKIKIGTPYIPWRSMIAIRNKVIHEYFGIDFEILWKTIKDDLPKLKKEIKILL
jgi:uncharacterized protein with HEPN domain